MSPRPPFQTRPLDWNLSPYTGWTREHYGEFADHLLLSARQWAGPGNSHITAPGAEGGYGRRVDGLEGFSRTFMLAGFRLGGDNGADPHGFAEWYAEGFRHGTDPASANAWVGINEHDQAKVEAAALALGLDHTREWLWDRMDPAVQEQVINYFAHVIDAHYPPINWVWFRIVVQQFLKSVGGPFSRDNMEADLALHDGFVRGHGWYADGEERAYDHYTGWALHLYPVLWHRMAGPDDEFAGPRRARDLSYLDEFLPDALRLVGADGGPLVQGRSLIYRFAAAAPFWAGALTGTTAAAPGLLRRAAGGVVKHFTDHGVPAANGQLTLGWHHAWPSLAQSYSGPGSPYWAAKGLAGLLLPAEHPVWTEPELPLPVEEGDVAAVAQAPGWLITGTRADGVVRVINHGTDHSVQGAEGSDSPLYARLGYSTATAPVVAGGTQNDPLDQSVTLADPAGLPSHRAGFTTLFTKTVPVNRPGESSACPDMAVAGASTARTHWVRKTAETRDHGSGYEGDVRRGAPVTTVSIARGGWEVRLVRVDRAPAPDEVGLGVLTVGGWPLPLESEGSADPATGAARGASAPWAVASAGPLRSEVHPLAGFDAAGVTELANATPLAARTAVPWCATSGVPETGQWHAAAIRLGSETDSSASQVPHLVGFEPKLATAVVQWADGGQTRLELPEVGQA